MTPLLRRAEIQLVDLLDSAFDFDPALRAWLPRRFRSRSSRRSGPAP